MKTMAKQRLHAATKTHTTLTQLQSQTQEKQLTQHTLTRTRPLGLLPPHRNLSHLLRRHQQSAATTG